MRNFRLKLFFVLTALMSSSALWAADGDVFTAKTVEGVDMTFKVTSEDSKTCSVGGGMSDSSIPVETEGNITIPAEANGYEVTSIGRYAFYECSSLTDIVIPESVTSIGYAAFEGCSNLTSIVIPNGVTELGASVFRTCSSLTSVVIPNGITIIDDLTFDGCSSLTSLVIPNGVTNGGEYNQEIKGETNVEIIPVIA